MKEFKGTPGPWFWQTYEMQDYAVLGPAGSDCLTCVIDDGSANGEYSPTINIDSPDAHLIAAAPELLDALQKMVGHYRTIGCGPHDYPSDHPIGIAYAAINKALGN